MYWIEFNYVCPIESDEEENPDDDMYDDDGEDGEKEGDEDEDGDTRMGSSGIRGEGLDGQVNFVVLELLSHFLRGIQLNVKITSIWILSR